MTRYSVLARNAKADAVCALLNGGLLVLMDELRDELPLAVLKFGTPAFLPAVEGAAKARAMVSGPGRREGMPRRFICITKVGEQVWGGTCGLRTKDGPAFDMYVSQVVEEGGEVRVTGFTYVEPE